MAKGINKIKDFTSAELGKYENLYSKIMFAIDDIQTFLPEDQFRERRYVSKLGTLKTYIEKIKNADYQAEKTGIFASDEKYKTELIRYKHTVEEELSKLEKCAECACLNCDNEGCKFNSCLGCRHKACVVSCDKERNTLIKVDDWILDLTDDESGSKDRYDVLGIVEDTVYEQQFILLQNVRNEDDKLVMKYTAGLKDDIFEEITEPEAFDQVVGYFMNAV